jgi:arginyl-tRNA synthetase
VRDPIAGLTAALAEIAGADTTLERPSDPTHGDYATNVAMKLAGARRQPPRAIAEELADQASRVDGVDHLEVAGPGFLNVFLSDAWIGAALAAMLEAGDRFGGGSAATPERIQVEMVSANPTGPLTVGSARNGAYGDSVARLLEFAGHAVSREYYYNDSGSQMDRFRASVDAVRNGMRVPEDGYHGEYLDELAAQPGDPVESMLERIEETLRRFRIRFDSFAKQSTIEQRLPAILPRLDTYERDGALFVRSTAHGDDKDRVLVRSPERGGLPTYEAADVAYLVDKMERGFTRVIYVLGADHHGVRGWYAVVAGMLGYDPGRVEVLLYQLVHLIQAGEVTKMSKRRGDVVLLDELMDEIGVDATRWYLVSRGHDQTIEIDIDLAIERTTTSSTLTRASQGFFATRTPPNRPRRSCHRCWRKSARS